MDAITICIRSEGVKDKNLVLDICSKYIIMIAIATAAG
jgi:hypothetical protein